MDQVPHSPQTFRDLAEADLRRVARLIIKIQYEMTGSFGWRSASRIAFSGRRHLGVS